MQHAYLQTLDSCVLGVATFFEISGLSSQCLLLVLRKERAQHRQVVLGNAGNTTEVTRIRRGYFATAENPLEIFICRPEAFCPGGTPGLLKQLPNLKSERLVHKPPSF